MLYVHPAAAGQGVGAMLVDALEKLAAARGATQADDGRQRQRERFFQQARLCRAAAQHRAAAATSGLPTRRWKRNSPAKEATHETPDTPFPRHWLYYIVLKFVMLGAARRAGALCLRGPVACDEQRALYLFDTTLRDGAQTNGVDFTLHDKLAIAGMLDELGIDYVEGGYPGANPTDTELFCAGAQASTRPSPRSA